MEYTDDIIIIPAETAAHMWMDRFIKEYEHGINDGVVVNGKKITWTGDFKEHSIDFQKDRFIIDGNEIFITAELWKKYLKMREITGAIYVRAPKKIAFPDDWSDLSDEQVLENIQYLQKKYKKYEISRPDDRRIKIDNVLICRDNEGSVGNGRTYYTINNKKYYRHEDNAKELVDLMHLCKMHMLPFKDKAKKWVDDNKDLIVGAGGTVLLFLCVVGLVHFNNKAMKKEKQELKREIINDVIDSLHKEQQKTLNYNDTINQKVR